MPVLCGACLAQIDPAAAVCSRCGRETSAPEPNLSVLIDWQGIAAVVADERALLDEIDLVAGEMAQLGRALELSRIGYDRDRLLRLIVAYVRNRR